MLGGSLLGDILDAGAANQGRDGSAAGFRTPVYVYDLDAIAAEARSLAAGFGGARHLIAYAVKANSAGPIIRTLAAAGCGAEVVSGPELELVLACGLRPDQILYSGVAKTEAELDRAISTGDRGIFAIQMESVEEIARVDARATALGRRARASIRVNPGVVADTHAHVATGHDEAKFGVARGDLPAAWAALEASRSIELVGLSCHVGSQLTRMDDYLASAEELLAVAAAREAGSGPLAFVDFGGGFGIDYGSGCPLTPADFAREASKLLARSPLAGRLLVVEPGRSLVGAHGVLCATVIMTKRSRATDPARGERRWLMIDAGMNDLIRPALYAAHHRIEPIDAPPPAPGSSSSALGWRVVGPVCESSDDFGEHLFDEPPRRVVIRDAGAYGFTMASEYNGRALAAEVFLSGGSIVAVAGGRSAPSWAEERARIGLT